ncbi:MAG: hypothetical protein ABTA24_10665 [Arthrobacter sp.]
MAIFTPPQPGTLPAALKLLVDILIPSGIVSVVWGASASMGFGLAVGLGMAVTTVSGPGQSALLVLLGAALGALASLAGSTPWAIAVLIFVSAILSAVSNQRSAGLLSLAPVIVMEPIRRNSARLLDSRDRSDGAAAAMPMLLIFASLGDIGRGFELTVERVAFTAVGFAVAVLLAILLRRWEGGGRAAGNAGPAAG